MSHSRQGVHGTSQLIHGRAVHRCSNPGQRNSHYTITACLSAKRCSARAAPTRGVPVAGVV